MYISFTYSKIKFLLLNKLLCSVWGVKCYQWLHLLHYKYSITLLCITLMWFISEEKNIYILFLKCFKIILFFSFTFSIFFPLFPSLPFLFPAFHMCVQFFTSQSFPHLLIYLFILTLTFTIQLFSFLDNISPNLYSLYLLLINLLIYFLHLTNLQV